MAAGTSNAQKSWDLVQVNATYLSGSLTASKAHRINWHSPANERSSQVFCISVFGTLRFLPDADDFLATLFSDVLPLAARGGPWVLRFEHTDRSRLGETGSGTPTNVDVFCESPLAAVCIESKFVFDAEEGFGGCGQAARGDCAGFYGPKSDLKTGLNDSCRLEAKEGQRDPRLYWKIGRQFFQERVFQQQEPGDRCPFTGSNYQLMRNFLFAAESAGPDRSYGVIGIAPNKRSSTISAQLDSFQNDVLRKQFQGKVATRTYDLLAQKLAGSSHSRSRKLAEFIQERIMTLA